MRMAWRLAWDPLCSVQCLAGQSTGTYIGSCFAADTLRCCLQKGQGHGPFCQERQ